jgi:hypothetical protein
MAQRNKALRASRKQSHKLRPDDRKEIRKNRKAVDVYVEAEDLIGNVGGKKKHDYKPEYAQLAAVVVSVYGSTPAELGKVFGVPAPFIMRWINQHSDFRDAVENATKNCNIMVMQRLFRQCMGYKVKTERLFYDGRAGKVIKGTYTETVKPDTTAMVFWLKNRMPDKWVDKVAAQVDGKGIADELQKVFDQKVTPDAALDTYQKLLEIEHQAVKVEPEEVIFTQKRPKPEVERVKATDTEVLSDD